MGAARKALLVASTGGHLEQLARLEGRLSPQFESVQFATFDDQQSRSLLAERDVVYVERIPPRGLREASRVLRPALQEVKQGGYTDVISTGSAIAVPFMLAARCHGVRAHYIESAARSDGPSLTGRLVSRIPGVNLLRSTKDGPRVHGGTAVRCSIGS